MRFAIVPLALALLLAGCASVPAAPVEADTGAAGSVVALRVIPVNHTVSWSGNLGAEPCGVPGTTTCSLFDESWRLLDSNLRDPSVPELNPGLEAPPMERTVHDAGALFWRLSGELRLESSTARSEVNLRVFVLDGDGGEGREALFVHGTDRITVETTDLFLEEGERDLRFVLELAEQDARTLLAPVRVTGEILAQAFVDAGDEPVVLS
ncbi:MAG: hypothetical protein AABX89_03535 [Candidatus Thermoplasmatota archaeon]